MEDVDGDAAASGDEGVADWHEEVSLSSPAIGDDEDGVYYHATLEFNSEEEEEEDAGSDEMDATQVQRSPPPPNGGGVFDDDDDDGDCTQVQQVPAGRADGAGGTPPCI